MNVAQRAIAVLGMHRSGTSCLTGLLEDAGVFLGDVSKKNPFNRKGNQEKLGIMQLHDEVLAANNASWDNPPQSAMQWSEDQVSRLREIIADYSNVPVWGFKDPRSLFALDQWRQELPTIEFIGTLRHPLAVARSLHNRGKIPLEEGVEIWRRYNQRLLDTWRNSPFPIVNFNLAPNDYLHDVKSALNTMNIMQSSKKLEFFDESLRNADGDMSEEDLGEEVNSLYSKLIECAQSSNI